MFSLLFIYTVYIVYCLFLPGLLMVFLMVVCQFVAMIFSR